MNFLKVATQATTESLFLLLETKKDESLLFGSICKEVRDLKSCSTALRYKYLVFHHSVDLDFPAEEKMHVAEALILHFPRLKKERKKVYKKFRHYEYLSRQDTWLHLLLAACMKYDMTIGQYSILLESNFLNLNYSREFCGHIRKWLDVLKKIFDTYKL